MGFIENDDAVFYDFLVAVQQICIKQIVVRHDEERSEVLCLHWVEVRAKLLRSPKVFHFLNIQELVCQFSLSYGYHILFFFVKKACSLNYLWILLALEVLSYLFHQFYPFAACLDLLLSFEHIKTPLEAQLFPRCEDGHIGTVAGFLKFLLDLFELRMCSGHVNDVMLDLFLFELLLDKGADRSKQAKSLTCSSWRFQQSISPFLQSFKHVPHVFYLNIVWLIREVYLCITNDQFLLILCQILIHNENIVEL